MSSSLSSLLDFNYNEESLYIRKFKITISAYFVYWVITSYLSISQPTNLLHLIRTYTYVYIVFGGTKKESFSI